MMYSNSEGTINGGCCYFYDNPHGIIHGGKGTVKLLKNLKNKTVKVILDENSYKSNLERKYHKRDFQLVFVNSDIESLRHLSLYYPDVKHNVLREVLSVNHRPSVDKKLNKKNIEKFGFAVSCPNGTIRELYVEEIFFLFSNFFSDKKELTKRSKEEKCVN